MIGAMKQLMTALYVFVMLTAAIAAQTTKYGVTVTPEKNVDYTSFKTYAWTRGQPSADKKVDAQIIAAIDRELAKDMKKLPAEPADVLVSYGSLARTDVDVRGKKDEKGLLPQYSVGSLVVVFYEPKTRRQLLRMRVDMPIDTKPAELEASINKAVEMMFAEYPPRKKK
jgi:hypothetical protein